MARNTAPNHSKFDMVLVSDLTIDPAAQRKLSMTWVNKHTDSFDVDQLGYIVVNRRDDARMYVVDGMHRVELMRAVGWGDQRIHAEVFNGLSQAEEAELFNARNDPRAVKKFDRFRISVTAKNERACAIVSIVESVGLVVSDQGVAGAITAVDKLERIFSGAGIASEREGGMALKNTLMVIRNAWGKSPPGFNGLIIHGLGLVQLRYRDEIDQAALSKKLAPVKGGAPGLLGNARSLHELSGRPVHDCVASIIVDIYNKGRRVGMLPDWEIKKRNRGESDDISRRPERVSTAPPALHSPMQDY